MADTLPFPTEGVLPKTETGASQFLQDNPQWDGRGITVAIFDTGVDPGAAGLQLTSDGRPKIIDVVDCTGSGDVETTEVREFDPEIRSIVGLSGRTLRLGEWSCPSRKIHLGLKRAYEILPEPLVKRIKEERLETFQEMQRKAEASAQQKLSEFIQQDGKKSESQKLQKKDFEAILSGLSDQMEQFTDGGPVFDCVVFFDGSKWRAVVDTDCEGDLTRAPVLTNFRDERQHATLRGIPWTKSCSLLLNYAVNIYEDGKRLSIVADAGSHGTHVAGIAAANFPDKPSLNGIAPGAQIVSCKIGDTRLGSMETGTGLVRALLVAKENGCDLINLSYGESCLYPEVGRFIELASEFVNRHKIIFVSSAGNNGPALSTVGAPGGTTSAIIGVGAYVSPGMMEVEYSLRETISNGTNYTWSSRGPAIDGHMGISVCAPGGAIAPVPTWTLQNKQLMNGTSMSSPNCCGGIALLLSALKAENIEFSPHSIRRAIENTAVQVDGIEPFALGHGLLQVPRAFQYLKQFQSNKWNHVPLVASLATKERGIYLRNASDLEKSKSFQITVIPQFHPECENTEKVDFEMDLVLRSNVSWVHVPKQLVVNGQGGVHASKGFEVVVDGEDKLLDKGVHLGMVEGFDASAPGRGPMFQLPVTVVKPHKIEDDGEFRFKIYGRTYQPGCVDRHFVHVPEGATCAQFSFRTKELDGSHMIVVHTLQLLPGIPTTGRNRHELEKYIRLKPHDEVVHCVAVRGGSTMEICLCKWWASLGTCTADVEVEFHGTILSTKTLSITSGGPESLEICTPLRAENLSISAKATHLRKFYVPTKNVIHLLDPNRYILPLGRQVYELELHYAFEQSEKELVKCQPSVKGLVDLLYDSPFESQMWMVFDSNKQVMGIGDALREYPVSLPKGKYTLRLSIRHDKRESLDKLKSLVVLVDFALAKDISFNVYSSLHQAVQSGAKFSSGKSIPGARTLVYLTPPSDKAPGAKSGDVLVGKVVVSKVGEHKEECVLNYLVGKDEDPEEEKEEVTKTDAELLSDAVRDAQLGRMKKLREDKKWEAFDGLAAELLKSHAGHLPLMKEIMLKECAEGESDSLPQRRLRCSAGVKAASAVIGACDVPALAAHYGVRYDSDDAAQKAVRKEMDKKKEALVEAILLKAERISELMVPAPGQEAADGLGGIDGERSLMEELEGAWADIRQWINPKEAKLETQVRYALVCSSVERRAGRSGAALSELLRVAKSKEGAQSKKILDELRELSAQLGWTHWQSYYSEMHLKSFPRSYPLF